MAIGWATGGWATLASMVARLRAPHPSLCKRMPVAPSALGEQMEADIHSYGDTSAALASLVYILVLVPVGKAP